MLVDQTVARKSNSVWLKFDSDDHTARSNLWSYVLISSLGDGSAGCAGAEPDPVQCSGELFSRHFRQQSHTPAVPWDACQPDHLQGVWQHQRETGQKEECALVFSQYLFLLPAVQL